MTFHTPRVLDLTALEASEERPSRPGNTELHVLRLALDLQLDAMLLTLGGAANSDSHGVGDDGSVPWRRWLGEDLELAEMLAGVLLNGEADPVQLGGGLGKANVETALENLAARYHSMEHLLLSVLDRPVSGQARSAASEALRRCRSRLEELHACRREVIGSAPAARAAFLPGELLG